jgi:CRP/FNR family transcriptional regulator
MAGPSQSELLAAMRKVPMFSALAEPAVRDLLAACHTVALATGRQVFTPSQPADRFYVVLSGRVKLYKLSARGDEQTLHLFGPGDTFGEAAMLGGGAFPAMCEVLQDARLLVVPRRAIVAAVSRSGELAMAMLAGMSAKLREFNRLIGDLSLKDVPSRLAGVLLELHRSAGAATFRLPQTKRQLAARIGTIPETFSRALGRMKADGVLRVRGSQITILDAAALEELAGTSR